MANEIPIAPLSPVYAMIKAYLKVIPYPKFLNHLRKHVIEKNLAKIHMK